MIMHEGRSSTAVMTPKVKIAVALFLCVVAIAGCARTRTEEQRAVGTARRELQTVARFAGSRSGEIIWRVNTDQKVVALTLDDGPDPKYTPRVLKLAHDKGLKLTFFLVGREIQLHPELARREVAAGHVIGNHTWDHPTLTYDTQRQDISEIERCENEIEKICGERTHLFRPPKGMWDGDTFLAALELGYRMILWSVTVEHHSAKTPQAMAERVIRKIGPGMIILAHDGEPCSPIDREKTIRALPILVEGLQKQGYQFVTVPELLALGKEKR